MCNLSNGKNSLNIQNVQKCYLILVAFLQNESIEYSLESVCVCFRVSVFLHDYSKSNMKLEYIVVYKNISDKFDIEYCRTKVKVMARHFFQLQFFSNYRNTNCQVLYLSFGTFWKL